MDNLRTVKTRANPPEMILFAGDYTTRRQMRAHALAPQCKQKGHVRLAGRAKAEARQAIRRC